MTWQQIVDALATYRRPGTPVFATHFRRLPAGLVDRRHTAPLLGILADADLPPKIRAHAAGALGEIGDRAAVPDLVAAVERVEIPGHQQLAAVCLAKILARHGDPARRRLAPAHPRLYSALRRLRRRSHTTPAFAPEVPWDHRPGTPGWRAEVGRAVAALERLLGQSPEGASST